MWEGEYTVVQDWYIMSDVCGCRNGGISNNDNLI